MEAFSLHKRKKRGEGKKEKLIEINIKIINNSHSNLLKNRYIRQKIETYEILFTSYYKFLQIMGACSAGAFLKAVARDNVSNY